MFSHPQSTEVKCLHRSTTSEIAASVCMKMFSVRSSGRWVCAVCKVHPTFIQSFEALGTHGEVRREPQSEDGAGADDAGRELKSRQPKFQKEMNTVKKHELVTEAYVMKPFNSSFHCGLFIWHKSLHNCMIHIPGVAR